MALIDEAKIKVFGGNGGNGCVSFRREKYIPYGGPNGGNGGDGGNVILKATHDKASLLDFKYQPKYEGERGEHGMGKDMFGRAGEDEVILVPIGTLVFDLDSGELLCDLIEEGQTFVAAKGGRGGKGNLAFKTSTNRAPRNSTPGGLGENRELRLELRLLADIGLVGLPNAGKSSFLTAISRARPKIADYPFTTLEPNLGVADHKGQQLVIADLPGLIEGAAEGAGLGHRFLKHVARNRMLLHLVEVTYSDEEILKNIEVIREEIRRFDSDLLNREECLVFTKIDLMTAEDLAAKKASLEKLGLKGYFISSQTKAGMEELLDYLSAQIAKWKPEPVIVTPEEIVLTQETEDNDRHLRWNI